MDALELIKTRRSIRRYAAEQVSREDVERVVEAGLYAPSAGGGQRSMVVAVNNTELTARIGRMNMAGFSRANLAGSYVSHDQPSAIVSRAEKTFVGPEGQALLREWGVPEGYVCRAFLALGYCDGPYPATKPRRAGRSLIID